MTVQLVLQPEQYRDLGVIRDLGPATLAAIVSSLTDLDPQPIRPFEIRQALAGVLPDQPQEANILLRQLLSLYTLKRERELSVEELLEALISGISRSEPPWNEEQLASWEKMQPQLKEFFSLESVLTVVKSLELSFDHVNLLQNAKIITDIRPIFNEEGSEIKAAVISFVLRLYFDSIEGSKSLSVSMDERDIERLSDSCSRALRKAKASKEFMNKSGIQRVFICGSEE